MRFRTFSQIALCLLWVWPLTAGSIYGSVAITRDNREQKQHDFSSVVVWLERLDAPAAPILGRYRMDQVHKTFKPHLLVMDVGSTVDFPNLDPIFHNAFSNFEGQTFDISLYPPGTSRSETMTRPGVVRIFCNIHPTMSAVIVVLQTPYYAVTPKSGDFQIANVPPGEYRVNFFYERATSDVLQSLRRVITIGNGQQHLDTIQISENGYLPLPHKNKYGLDYPASAKDERYGSLTQ